MQPRKYINWFFRCIALGELLPLNGKRVLYLKNFTDAVYFRFRLNRVYRRAKA
jgi:hypothetical protein